MKYRRLGRTGVRISEIVFGAGWVGGILIHGDDETRRRALRKAFDAGINWIDTAASYGQGKSEEALGWLLKEFAEKPHLSTKFRLEGEADVEGQARRSFEASLKRLQRDRVDLLQLHNPIAAAAGGAGASGGAVTLKTAMAAADAMAKLREEGLTRWVGFTALGEAGPLGQAIASGRFDTAQVYYNMLNPSAGRAVPAGWEAGDFGNLIAACQKHDVGVLNIRVMAAGVIAADARHGREAPITPNAEMAAEERRAKLLLQALGPLDGTRAQAAIRFCLGHPGVSGALLGAAELSHIDEAVAAVEMGRLPADRLAKLDRLYETDFGRL
jgi:aryl-alcohol dehydrogenase-like predicted oxidoreductase